MASSSRPHHRYTYAQYAAVERESSTKHEFFDGEIYAMAAGTEDHAALAVSTLAALLAAVGDRRCRVSSSDLRIYVEAIGLATFPDGSVLCGPMQQHPPSPDATAVNPPRSRWHMADARRDRGRPDLGGGPRRGADRRRDLSQLIDRALTPD